AGRMPEIILFRILPGVELAFRVDPFGLLFAAGASLLWILTSFYSIGYMRSLNEHAQTRYFACFALSLSATIGVAFSANLFTLFRFGFAKSALMPVHSWLPAAMVAPTPVSALLHAVAVVKTGVFSTLRVFLFIFGLNAMRELGADQLALVAASVTILVASLLALGHDNLKARLALSTVSQLSYIILGAALLNSRGVTGGVAHITNHAVSKITLFFCAGSIYVSTHKTEISQLSGLARRMPWTMAAFSLSSLSIVGIPLTSGFVSKWYLALGTVDRQSLILLAVLLVSSLLSAAYLGQILYKAYFEFETEPASHDEVHEVPWIVAPLTITAAASLFLGIYPAFVLSLV